MHYRKLVDSLRKFRTWHRFFGTSLVLFMIISAVSGVLLGWKKDVNLLQPPAQEGSSADLQKWTGVDEIASSAIHAVDSVVGRSIEIDKMDVRPDKGIVKVLFKEGYWEVQVDGVSGKPLSVLQRHSDWIEHIHDGSIVGDLFKLIYTNTIGWGLLILALSGIWLWYGPKMVRKIKSN